MAVDISLIEEEDSQTIVLVSDEEPIPIEELTTWVNTYADAHILFRSEEENSALLYEKMKYAIPKSKSDFIVEINSFDEHYFITSHGYENLLLNIVGNEYTDKEILDFLKLYSLFGIILEEEMLDTDLVDKIKELGIDIYTEQDNSIEILHNKKES